MLRHLHVHFFVAPPDSVMVMQWQKTPFVE
jgi:hypothetical protein